MRQSQGLLHSRWVLLLNFLLSLYPNINSTVSVCLSVYFCHSPNLTEIYWLFITCETLDTQKYLKKIPTLKDIRTQEEDCRAMLIFRDSADPSLLSVPQHYSPLALFLRHLFGSPLPIFISTQPLYWTFFKFYFILLLPTLGDLLSSHTKLL